MLFWKLNITEEKSCKLYEATTVDIPLGCEEQWCVGVGKHMKWGLGLWLLTKKNFCAAASGGAVQVEPSRQFEFKKWRPGSWWWYTPVLLALRDAKTGGLQVHGLPRLIAKHFYQNKQTNNQQQQDCKQTHVVESPNHTECLGQNCGMSLLLKKEALISSLTPISAT